MSDFFTRVEIAFYPEYLNHWLRFGTPDMQQDLDRRRSLALFKPGRVFGYVRWRANEYGTQDWRFVVAITGEPLCFLSRIEGIYPGVKILLFTRGNTKVKRALLQIEVLETDAFELGNISPAYYRHVHNRILTGRPVRTYSDAQHAAHMAAQQV